MAGRAHARGGVVEGKASRGLRAVVAGGPARAHALPAVALLRQGAIVRGEATHCVGHRSAVKSVRQARRHTGYYHYMHMLPNIKYCNTRVLISICFISLVFTKPTKSILGRILPIIHTLLR